MKREGKRAFWTGTKGGWRAPNRHMIQSGEDAILKTTGARICY